MIHLTKLDPNKVHYFIRHFEDTPENPLGEIDPMTGQPWKEYDGTGLLTIHGNAGEITGLLRIPPGAYAELKAEVVHREPIKKLIGERWKNQKKLRVEISLE